MNDVIVAVEAVTVTAGGDTVSGSIFTDDLRGISRTPEGLRKQIGKAL